MNETFKKQNRIENNQVLIDFEFSFAPILVNRVSRFIIKNTGEFLIGDSRITPDPIH